MPDKGLRFRTPDGSAYGRPPQRADEEVARVGPGTPCGELFRRYWLPIAEASKVTTRPQNIRILGEDLVMFRDGMGRVGLLYPRCMHRGTSLSLVDFLEDNIRMRRWIFDPATRMDAIKQVSDIAKIPVQQYSDWIYLGSADKVDPRVESLGKTFEAVTRTAVVI